jgi:hypothetical protein
MTFWRHLAIIALGSVVSYGVLFIMILETHGNGLSSWWAIALRMPTWVGTKFAVHNNQSDNLAFYATWLGQCVVGGILIDLVTSFVLLKKRGRITH